MKTNFAWHLVVIVCVIIGACAMRYDVKTGPDTMPLRLDRWTGQTWNLSNAGGLFQWTPMAEPSR